MAKNKKDPKNAEAKEIAKKLCGKYNEFGVVIEATGKSGMKSDIEYYLNNVFYKSDPIKWVVKEHSLDRAKDDIYRYELDYQDGISVYNL